MKEFYLTTKSGEVINVVRISDYKSAVTYFAKIKNIDEKDLVTIFNVK